MLNQLKRPAGARKRHKVVGRGRGSGHGKTSGRGNKGQNARASGGVRPGFEGGQMPLIRRVPKRGFTFTPKAAYEVVNLEKIEALRADAEVTPEVLKKAGMIKSKHPKVKILGQGELKHAVIVKAHAFSKAAMDKIAKAGGKALVLAEVTRKTAAV